MIERGERGHDAELRGDEARHVKRGLADADDRGRGRASRRLESGVVETGDDESVRVGRLADLLDQARNREGLVEIALDAGRPELGIDGVTSTPGEAAALAAAPIFSVIERVVFGLMT